MITTLYFAAATPVTKSAFAIKALRRLFFLIYLSSLGTFICGGRATATELDRVFPLKTVKLHY